LFKEIEMTIERDNSIIFDDQGRKAYMFSMFDGPARIIRVTDRTRDCKGFEESYLIAVR
jgi:hypothetical protein